MRIEERGHDGESGGPHHNAGRADSGEPEPPRDGHHTLSARYNVQVLRATEITSTTAIATIAMHPATSKNRYRLPSTQGRTKATTFPTARRIRISVGLNFQNDRWNVPSV